MASGGNTLEVEVGWPADALWPNKSAHRYVESRSRKAAKREAYYAAKLMMPHDWAPEGETVNIHLIVHCKPTGPHPDKDNTVAAVKSHLDGIALAIGMNDRNFEAPTVSFADRCPRGSITVSIG
jgi:crossover junction endodeoxyribonuclease RusA